MEYKFKKGDYVVCINNKGILLPELSLEKIYLVSRSSIKVVSLEGIEGYIFNKRRFIPAPFMDTPLYKKLDS